MKKYNETTIIYSIQIYYVISIMILLLKLEQNKLIERI
jgi:hypothetical protein